MKKCPNCGAPMNDCDVFCQNCGKKVDEAELPVVANSHKVCPHCGALMSGEDAFCPNCGKKCPKGKTCSSCGAAISDKDMYCPNCGKAVECPRKYDKWIVISLIVIAVIGGGVYTFLNCSDNKWKTKGESEEYSETKEIEEVFAEAQRLISINDTESLKAGLAIMDSLSNIPTPYIPAIYEMARTYGWHSEQSDSASVARKRLLGIEMDSQYLPKDREKSNDAMRYFNMIKNIGDSAYADINAESTYRLACYYLMPNNLFQQDFKEGKELLVVARGWASLAGKYDLIDYIDAVLPMFE